MSRQVDLSAAGPFTSSSEPGRARLSALLNRSFELPGEMEARVREILERVRAEGDQALVEYTRRFDAPEFDASMIQVPEQEVEEARRRVEGPFMAALKKAAANIRRFHERQLPNSWFLPKDDGTVLGQMVRPVDCAGLYVPGGAGGKTPLVSSVLMNALPAAIAGVPRIVLTTPPTEDGGVSPYILAAAREAGVHQVFRAGSAWAVAAMAFGTETIPRVDVIAGPGNIFVTIAKKLVSGMVGIDMIAGPSEILIMADESARPAFAAADMLSQAEHDPMATSILLTTSEELAGRVMSELARQLAALDRAETAGASLEANGLVLVVRDMEEAVEISNRIGPEHLELMVRDPWGLLPKIRHAGAVFLGGYTPEPIGDYIAGPNHVLPTMGTSRFSSALGVETFIKRTSIISYSRQAFDADAEDVMLLADIEGLTAHAGSIRVRKEQA